MANDTLMYYTVKDGGLMNGATMHKQYSNVHTLAF